MSRDTVSRSSRDHVRRVSANDKRGFSHVVHVTMVTWCTLSWSRDARVMLQLETLEMEGASND